MGGVEWLCPGCDQMWPAYTNVDAYKKHKRANEVHPDKACKQLYEESKMTDERVLRQFDRAADEVIICSFRNTEEIVAICGVCDTQSPTENCIIGRWKDVDPILDEIVQKAEQHFREVPHEG